MAKISTQEVVTIALISRIELKQDEIAPITHQLEQVLSYAARVADVATVDAGEGTQNRNVYRDDLVTASMPDPILAQAPVREGDYFGVPAIIENN